MVNLRSIWLVASFEWRAATRNWWLMLYAGLLLLLILGVALLSTNDLSNLERGQFGRTAAAMTNIVMVLIPLFALIAGATSITPDRERGLFGYFLSHPLTTPELFFGKYLGGAAALTVVLAAGLGAGAIGLATSGVLELSGFAWLVLLSWFLTLASFSVGMLISSVTRRSPMAVGLAIVAWMVLLFLGDLGLMAAATVTRIDLRLVVVAAIANPAEAFKVAAVDRLGTSLDALGPAGQWLADTMGAGLIPLLASVLLVWMTVPLLLALLHLRRSDLA